MYVASPAPSLCLLASTILTFSGITALVVVICCSAVMLLLHHTPVGAMLHEHIPDRPRRRLLLACVGFFLTFGSVRALTWSIHRQIGPFHDIQMGGRHIHHLVWGILLVLTVGFGWLVEWGTGTGDSSILMSRLMSLLYGSGAALTLDEFALWLNLRDVYWAPEGRASIDAALLFGSLLAIGGFGAPLFRAIAKRIVAK
jgi:hypothetical protein